jgi:hypothetical protein
MKVCWLVVKKLMGGSAHCEEPGYIISSSHTDVYRDCTIEGDGLPVFINARSEEHAQVNTRAIG